MKLTDLLRHPVRFEPPAVRTPKGFETVCRRIDERWGDWMSPPDEKDEKRILDELLRRIDGQDWAGAKVALVSTAARAAFAPHWRDEPQFAPVRRFLLDELAVSTRRSLLATMATVYLETWEPSAPHTRVLAERLAEALLRLPPRWRRPLSGLPGILDPGSAHRQIAERMAGSRTPFADLSASGLRDPHGAGFMSHVHRMFVDKLAPRIAAADETAVEALLEWLAPNPVAQLCGDQGARGVRALLEPWRLASPPETLRVHLRDRLVKIYGDPRGKSGGVWGALPAETRSVMLQWLAGETLETFLEILSSTVTSHMWPERRDFWRALYREGRIQEAWAAFDDASARRARERLRADSEGVELAHGRQIAGGQDAGKSLLIMKVGSKVVVEGTHNFKVHVIPETEHYAPPLYFREYSCNDFRKQVPDKQKKAHQSGWQSWVRERI